MLEWITQINNAVNGVVWGPAGLALLFGIEALLTVGLLTGWGFPAMGWLGLAYELLVWSALGGGGAGAAALVYALGFALLLLLRAWQGSAWSDAAHGWCSI